MEKLEKVLDLYNSLCAKIDKRDAKRKEAADDDDDDGDTDMYSRCGGNVDDAFWMGRYEGESCGEYDTWVSIRDELKTILGL